ncbi:hypothetical protein [Amycolatopsis vastitatis]|uniref:Uncharacterized protein n=1 Tax=Amycolatopsis vastitatis TaxID=1905142 RepID=A0A229TFX9_9PSEU|nr:hypothetical protein [Amycolatopsis vastitatis]OXM69649.1 hypothetical protein CF165_09070 [Amycolatopsis vastitatis]
MYELRAPVNYSFGQLTNPAAVSDTSMVSTDFASLQSGLTTSLYIPITLQDPANKQFEIVWATAHTGASNTLTVVRGREGSAARAWPASTLWACAPTLRDSVLPVPNAAALPPDPHVGLRALLQDTQQTVQWGYPGGWELEARRGILGLVKRNVQDTNTTQADSLFETLTITGMRATRYYKAVWVFNTNASGAVNPPNGTASIRLSAVGAAVTINDPAIRTQGIINQVYTNPGIVVETIFTVPVDGTYQLGCSANSGAASGGTTLTILASGAANEANAANKRAFWVEDMGIK